MPIKALLLDIGGVLLTKGWGRESRKAVAEVYHVDYDELAERHQLIFHIYEEGRITLDEYLQRVVFYEPRSFTPDQFKESIFKQSQPFADMLDFCKRLKSQYNLKAVALSNEGREIMLYRMREFNLTSLLDFFVCSCFVRTEKPDPAIFRFAMDQVQLSLDEVVYIDDTPMHVEVARELGIPSILHKDFDSTKSELGEMGLNDAFAEISPP